MLKIMLWERGLGKNNVLHWMITNFLHFRCWARGNELAMTLTCVNQKFPYRLVNHLFLAREGKMQDLPNGCERGWGWGSKLMSF